MQISNNEIHLWFARDDQIQDTSLLAAYSKLLNKEERIKKQKFHFDKDRHQYQVTRAMLRILLSAYHPEIDAEHWLFDKNEFGKPYIANTNVATPIKFNISHTQGLVVLAISKKTELGVDVENTVGKNNVLDLANHYFSGQEVKELLALPYDQKYKHFFDLWTLKEAYTKACGIGLYIPFSEFSFFFNTPSQIDITFSENRQDNPELWLFWQLVYRETYSVALAIKQKSLPEEKSSRKSYSITCREIVPLHSSEIITPDITRQSF